MARIASVALVVSAALLFGACGSDSSEGGSSGGGAGVDASSGGTNSGGSGGTSAGGTGTGGASGGTSGGAGGASGGASGSGAASSDGAAGTGGSSDAGMDADADAGPPVGFCSRPCGTVTDCCPAGSVDCPSNQYPNNYKCVLGACRAAECSTTQDCTSTNPKLDCLSLSGFHACGFGCSSDTDCSPPLTCIGLDDNGKKYCLAKGNGCSDDASCGGYGKCVDKVCVCYSDVDCTKTGFTKCAL
ncbi:MAG: hypothetical protein U0263_23445 [Polyangiaceae bacterium]